MTPDLSQLRDIHLPPGVSWWPLALGWWILIALVLVCALAAYLFRRHKQAGRWRRSALHELEQLRSSGQANSAKSQLGDLSVLLRRVAISRFPRSDVASLYGNAWLAFLDRTFGDDHPFQSDAGQLLIIGPYVDDARIGTSDLAALYALSEKWIRKLPGRMKK